MGNVRLTYADSDGNGSINPASEIISEKNYYPFGLEHKGYNNVVSSNSNSVAQNFGYNGKENNPELGIEWMDFSARNYDPALGRWMNIDPLAEQMRRHSPYNFAFDNPVYFIDPDGMKPQGCCPNPFAGTGAGIANAVKNRIDNVTTSVCNFFSDVGSAIGNALDFSDRGGYQIKGQKDGLVGSPDVAKDRTKVDIVEGGDELELMSTLYGPNLEGAAEGLDIVSNLVQEFVDPSTEEGGSISNSGSEEPTEMRAESPFSTFMMTFKDGSKTTNHEGSDVNATVDKASSILSTDSEVDSVQVKTFFTNSSPPSGYTRKEVDTTLIRSN